MANTTGKKYGGRTKGTPNKTTKEIRDVIRKVIESNVCEMDIWLKEIAEKNPQKAFELFLKLLDFIIPKINKVNFTDTIKVDKECSFLNVLEDSTIFDNEI